MIIEIKRQRRLVDDKKETFKTRLRNSFDAIDLPVPNQGDLRVILRNKKEEYFTNFYEEIEADQESEHKKNVKREVGIYAKEKINEMIEKNEGISFTIATIVCNVSAWQGGISLAVNTGQWFV